jgi:hypothetical protein
VNTHHFDADADPTSQPDADPDLVPDPSFQKNVQTREKVFK